jgi:hypothetical protein
MIQVKRWGIGLTMLAVAVLLITQKLHPAGGADVTTDKHMYHQGETMAITGVGFLPAHAISRTVQRPDKVIETVPNVFRCIGSDSGRVCIVAGVCWRPMCGATTCTRSVEAEVPPERVMSDF